MSVTAKDSIVIRNVYHMMAYAFRALDLQEYKKLAHEEFDQADDLLAAILATGIGTQVKRGLERGYRTVEDDIPSVRGRLNPLQTARHRAAGRQLARCAFDEFDEDTYKNRILKRAAEVLLASPGVSTERRTALKRCLLPLRNVSGIDARRVEWGRLRYDRNNAGYVLLMNVCYLVLSGSIMSDDEGDKSLATFLGGRELHALYEKFVLEYFRRHHSHSLKASAKVIAQEGDRPSFLPSLNTDVTLEGPGKTLIIDCKFYKRILNSYYGHETLSTANVNQLHMYVSSEAYATGREVEGMLLYAKTSEEHLEPASWSTAGLNYHFAALDLDREFPEIARDLDAIAAMVA